MVFDILFFRNEYINQKPKVNATVRSNNFVSIPKIEKRISSPKTKETKQTIIRTFSTLMFTISFAIIAKAFRGLEMNESSS